MALSNAEKVRQYRQRQKELERKAPDAADALFKAPFHKYMEDRWTDLDPLFDWAGIEPRDYAADGDSDPEWDEVDGPYRGALGRAERMVTCFSDLAIFLAEHIRDYKIGEINNRIREIEESDLSDPFIRKEALERIVFLRNYQDFLAKSRRVTIPNWKVPDRGIDE